MTLTTEHLIVDPFKILSDQYDKTQLIPREQSIQTLTIIARMAMLGQ